MSSHKSALDYNEPTDPSMFAHALETADLLMAELYALRYRFDALHPVWEHIPFAQTTLERVKQGIREAALTVQEKSNE